MPRKIHALLLFALLLAVFVPPILAEEAKAPDKETPAPAEPKERLSETTHRTRVGGKELSYKALAGELLLRDEAEKPQALMFYVAYFAQGSPGTKAAERPITFLFNGGPGSSAVWLHLGAFGPKRVRVDEMGVPGPPPYGLTDNPDSLLDVTDLVFVDPVSTGYSRTVPGVKAEPYHEVHKDVEAMADFIRRFLTRHGRWDSPIFILGESYGTIRGSGLVDVLLRRYGIYCNGLTLISPALNEMAFQEAGGNDLPYLVDVPSFAATAWYHHRLEPALQQRSLSEVVREADAFALGPYAHALLLGAELPTEERRTTLTQLARLIALPPEELDRRDLRIGSFDYAGELLKADRLRIGVLDSRYTGFPNSLATEGFSPTYQYSLYDPSNTVVNGAFTAALQQYLQRDLHYESETSYELLALPVAQSWDYGKVTNRYLYAADNLRSALSANPDLQVFMANGQYDLVTTTLATRYIVGHLGIDPRLRDNVTTAAYPAGHMMYMHQPSLDKLKQDLSRFYQTALEKKRTSPLAKPRSGEAKP
jgi:carboxypeptidase C (cathepsin A)